MTGTRNANRRLVTLLWKTRGGVDENLDSEGKESTLEWRRSELVPYWISDRSTVQNGSDQPTHLIASST